MSRLWPHLVLLAAVILAFGGSTDAGFVYDDHRFIEFNEALSSVRPLDYFSDAATASAGEGIQHDIYRPLRTLLFALERQLFGLDAGGYHVVSVLLQVIAAMLLFSLLMQWSGGAQIPSLLGALLFALHPMSVEVVAWVSSQGDQLAVIFMLLALRFVGRPGLAPPLLLCVGYALAILSKESALVLPALVPLAWLIVRHGQQKAGDDAAPRTSATQMWVRTGLLAGIAGLYFVVRFAVLPELAQVPGGWGGPVARLRGMLAGFGWYAGQLVWPTGFSFDFQLPLPQRFSDPEVVFGAGLLATTLLAGWFSWRRGWVFLCFASLGFLACLVPVSNVIVPLKAFVADRFLYPGLLCLAVLPLALWAHMPRRFGTAAVAIAAAILLALGLVSSERAEAWAGEKSLWEAVRQDRPSNPNAYQGLGYAFADEGRIKHAERAFRSYLEANPWDGKTRKEFGDILGLLADSLQLSPEAEARIGTSNTSIQSRRRIAWQAQQTLYMEAWRIWSRLGFERGRGSEALAHEMLLRLLRSALLSGEPERVRFANDQLILREGVNPGDAEQVLNKASWPRRATRVLSAWNAVRRDPPRDLSPTARSAFLRVRRLAVEGIGLSASAPHQELRKQVLGGLHELMNERRNSKRPPELFVWGPIIRLHLEANDVRGARALLEELRPYYPPEHPDHPWFRDLANDVSIALRRRRQPR